MRDSNLSTPPSQASSPGLVIWLRALTAKPTAGNKFMNIIKIYRSGRYRVTAENNCYCKSRSLFLKSTDQKQLFRIFERLSEFQAGAELIRSLLQIMETSKRTL